MSAGKPFETCIGRSLRNLSRGDGWVNNSNDITPVCDFQMKLPNGPNVVVECKEYSGNEGRFPLSNITTAERDHLTKMTWAGGLCLILVEHKLSSIDKRCFGADWLDWLAIEQQLGYVTVILYPLDDTPKMRRKPGTASVPLVDGLRSVLLTELFLEPCGRRYDLADWYRRLSEDPYRFSSAFLQDRKANYESNTPIFPEVSANV